MKKTTIVILLTLIVMAMPLFASGVTEKGTDFKEIDLNTATLETMESAWNNSVDSYTNQKESLKAAMDEALAKRDVEDYLALRSLYNALECPVITEEQTEILTTRILNSTDQEEKDAISTFLYKNSAYYHPTLTFDYSVKNGNYYRSLKKFVSDVPGTTVTAPSVSGDGVFLGWSLDGETVAYQSGDEITMPYSDTVLYALFSTGITFADSVTGIDTCIEGTEASVPVPVAEDPNMVFLGWYGKDGKKLDGDTVTVESGKSADYTALWRGVEIGDASIRYYEDGKIPASNQVVLTFPIKNAGNTALRNIKVSVNGEDTKVLSSSLKATLVGNESALNASFLIYTDGNKGEEIVLTAIIEDGSGNTWTKEFTFVIQ